MATIEEIIAGLPPLRGETGGESRIDPTLKPYLGLGLRRAEQLFFGPGPEFFPRQTYVSPSAQTLSALEQTEALARGDQPEIAAAQNAYLRGLSSLGKTAGGAFLSGSPYLQNVIESATRPIARQFSEETMPAIASQFSAAGRYGSGAMSRATGQAQESASRAIGDVASNLAFANYAQERGLQERAIGAQLQGATMAPQIYGQKFLPSQQLGQVGAAREEIEGLPLGEEMARFQFGQRIPYEQLQGFLSTVYGTPMGGSQFQPIPQAETNRFGQALGGAVIGGQLGSLFGRTAANPSGYGSYGAILGGLGGLLF